MRTGATFRRQSIRRRRRIRRAVDRPQGRPRLSCLFAIFQNKTPPLFRARTFLRPEAAVQPTFRVRTRLRGPSGASSKTLRTRDWRPGARPFHAICTKLGLLKMNSIDFVLGFQPGFPAAVCARNSRGGGIGPAPADSAIAAAIGCRKLNRASSTFVAGPQAGANLPPEGGAFRALRVVGAMLMTPS